MTGTLTRRTDERRPAAMKIEHAVLTGMPLRSLEQYLITLARDAGARWLTVEQTDEGVRIEYGRPG